MSIRDELKHGKDDIVAIESAEAAINYLGAKAELELRATQFDKISSDGTYVFEDTKDAEVISRVHGALTNLGSLAIEKALAVEAQARKLGISLSPEGNKYPECEVTRGEDSKGKDKSETLPPEHYALFDLSEEHGSQGEEHDVWRLSGSDGVEKNIIIPDELHELPEAEGKAEVVIGVIDGHTIALDRQTLQLNDLQVDILNVFLEKTSRSEWLSTAGMIDEYGIAAGRSTRSAARQAISLARKEIADFIREALPPEREDVGSFFLAKGDRASKEYRINPKYALKDLKKK